MTYCLGDAVSTTVEVSKETQRSILSDIEAQLYDSEIYQRAIAALQTMLGGATGTAQVLVKAVGREAIRLAFVQFTKQYKEIAPVASRLPSVAKEEPPLESSLSVVKNKPNSSSTVEAHQANPKFEIAAAVADNSDDIGKALKSATQAVDITKLHETAQVTASELRQERLREIGTELKQARHARSLSVEELYNKTLVPLRHIKALEIGCMDELPEDVYVRSFISLLGNALGLNGVAMAASLPAPDPLKYVLPSWHQVRSTEMTFHLNSVSTYFGYAAFVAGAVGGLSWLSQHPIFGVSVKHDAAISSQTSHSGDRAQSERTPGLRYNQKGVSIGADISPPEAISY